MDVQCSAHCSLIYVTFHCGNSCNRRLDGSIERYQNSILHLRHALRSGNTKKFKVATCCLIRVDLSEFTIDAFRYRCSKCVPIVYISMASFLLELRLAPGVMVLRLTTAAKTDNSSLVPSLAPRQLEWLQPWSRYNLSKPNIYPPHQRRIFVPPYIGLNGTLLHLHDRRSCGLKTSWIAKYHHENQGGCLRSLY